MSAPATPPAKQSAGRTRPRDGASPGAFAPSTRKSRALRQISIAVHPAASAPNTAEQRLIAQAGVGWPMYDTQEKSLQKIQLQTVQNG